MKAKFLAPLLCVLLFPVYMLLTQKPTLSELGTEHVYNHPVKKIKASATKNIAHPISKEDIVWLAKNVYFEARNQSEAGRIAVIMVTLNRMHSNKFPNTIKEVVTQSRGRLHRCQFSWYCDGVADKIHDWKTYNEIMTLILTHLPLSNTIDDITHGATFYHATYVKPYWAKHKIKTIQIGDHIFYRSKR